MASFKDAQEYVYDGNGRLVSYVNAGIASIVYNEVNLPAQITWTAAPLKKLEHLNEAGGTKLQKKFTTGTSVGVT